MHREPEHPGLPAATFRTLQRMLHGWGMVGFQGILFAFPVLWVIQAYFPSGLPYALIALASSIFISGSYKIRDRKETAELKEGIEQLLDEYPAMQIISLVIVMQVVMFTTVVLLAAGLGILIAGSWHPLGAVFLAGLLPLIDHELSGIHELLSPTGLTRYTVFKFLVFVGALWGVDISSTIRLLDRGGRLGHY